MKIEKAKGKYSNGVNWFYHYYYRSKTIRIILHGLYNSTFGIGYNYHGIRKGFWLK